MITFRSFLVCGCLAFALLPAKAMAAADTLTVVPAESLRWATPPGIPGLQAAWVLGSEAAAGPYLLRVRLDANTRIPPHVHPDERTTTVLRGTIHVGIGTEFDQQSLVAVSAGGVYRIPAGVPHFLWARDGAVEYQEGGVGPTATEMLPRPD